MSKNIYQIQEINRIDNLNYSNGLETSSYINENIENTSLTNVSNNLITNTPSAEETIIKFDIDDIEKKNGKRNSRQFNISPFVRRTPNTKADIIIQKIYFNRKNVIKNYQNTSTKKVEKNNLSFNSLNSLNSFTPSNINKQLLPNNILYNYENDNIVNYSKCMSNMSTVNTMSKTQTSQNDEDDNLIIINDPRRFEKSIINDSSISNDTGLTENNTRIKNELYSSDSSPISDSVNEKSTPSLSENYINNDLIYKRNNDKRNNDKINNDKRKRKYYRTIKLKKNNIQPINMNGIHQNEIHQNEIHQNEIHQNDIYETPGITPKVSPLSSPRDITQHLWNDLVENYYNEFQKLCKEEAEKYKYLYHRNELISNLLKFILLLSGCFTFTLSISIPTSLFMSTTTTISSCLTAVITSITGFFQFDKKSEIQYNIYRELDKLYNIISLEMLKPTYMRADPYEYILHLRNRRDELLKTLQKK